MIQNFTKKIIVLHFLFLLGLLSACLIDDCPDPQMYFLKEITTAAIDVIDTQHGEQLIQTDTLRNQLSFETINTVEFATVERPHSTVGLIASATAECIGEQVLNPILPERSAFYIDRELIIEGLSEPLPAFTNLLEVPEISQYITFPRYLLFGQIATTSIELNTQIGWEETTYVFYFEWHTGEEMLKNEVSVYLDLR